jgi:hypothetical protein
MELNRLRVNYKHNIFKHRKKIKYMHGWSFKVGDSVRFLGIEEDVEPYLIYERKKKLEKIKKYESEM